MAKARTREQIRRSARRQSSEAAVAPTPVEAILTQIKQRHDVEAEATKHERKEAALDDKFRNLEQWDPIIKRDRELRGEPSLVVDMIGTTLQQVVNSHRQSRPGVKFRPKGGGATKKGATYRQGVMRQIEHDSFAPAVYAHGFDAATSGGWGYWRVDVEHVEDHFEDLEIIINPILSRFQVRRDPTATHPTKRDARWWMVIDDMPADEYREEYPDSELASWDDLDPGDKALGDWINDDMVRVVEYWWKRKKKRRVLGLEDGRAVTVDIPAERAEARKMIRGRRYAATATKQNPKGLRITSHRDTDTEQVMWCKANAVELLEGNDDLTDGYEWPGKYIPLVEMVGEQLVVEGRIVRRGIVRRQRDAQTMVNVEVTDLVTTQARSPKHVWSGIEGQFGSGQPGDPSYDQYAEASSGRRPVVAAKMVKGPDGTALNPPRLESYEPPIQNLIQGISLATQFVRDTSGWYGAALGDLTPDRSGKAIDSLVRASEQSSSHFTSNFEVALSYTGDIINDLMGHVYTRPGRLVHMLGPKGEEDAILIRKLFRQTPEGPMPVPAGQENLETDEFVDFGIGKYGVVATPGRNHATQRQEKTEGLTAVGSSDPELMRIVAPDLIDSLDFPGADDLADRVNASLPPHLRRRKLGEPAIPREVAEQMAQMEGVTKELTAKVQELTRQQESKALENASKEAIAAQNNQTKLAIEELKASLKMTGDAMLAIQAGYDRLQVQMEAAEQRAHEETQAILSAISTPAKGASQAAPGPAAG